MKKLTGHVTAQFNYRTEEELKGNLRWWAIDRLKITDSDVWELDVNGLMALIEASGTRNFLTKNRWWTISQTKETVIDEPIVKISDDGDRDFCSFNFSIYSDSTFSLYNTLSNTLKEL